MAPILGVEVIRLGLEAPAAAPGASLGPAGPLSDVVVALPAGGADAYVTQGRGLGARRVTLRQLEAGLARPLRRRARPDPLRGAAPARSRAGQLGGLLAFGATDGQRFHPDQGIDLLAFFAGVFERCLRRWLA